MAALQVGCFQTAGMTEVAGPHAEQAGQLDLDAALEAVAIQCAQIQNCLGGYASTFDLMQVVALEAGCSQGAGLTGVAECVPHTGHAGQIDLETAVSA